MILILCCSRTYTNCAGGAVLTDQVISLSLECGAAGAELTCNDDDDEGCPCAPGGCDGENNAPRISNFDLTGSVPVFIYIGMWGENG